MSTLDARPVWVTGAAGLIGSWVVKTAPPHWRARPISRQELDLTDFAALDRVFRAEAPRAVIHCAALSRSPECEGAPRLAFKINVEVTRRLCELAAHIPLSFLSTDLVFDGRQGHYDESGQVNPLSVYAETKVAAERFVLENPRHTVIRTSLNGGPSPSQDRGFDEQMCRAWQQGQTLRLFTDEFRCPIPAEVTSLALWELLARECSGLFHVAGAERISRWDIGQILASKCPELRPSLIPGSIADWKGAPRPPDTSLNCQKAQRVLSFELPKWSDWLANLQLTRIRAS